MSCSVCRALPTDAELAAATAPGDALDDLQTYMDAVAKNSPMQPDALNRGVRNRPFESLAERDRLRALGMSEAAAPGLQTMNPLQRLRTAEEGEAKPSPSTHAEASAAYTAATAFCTDATACNSRSTRGGHSESQRR